MAAAHLHHFDAVTLAANLFQEEPDAVGLFRRALERATCIVSTQRECAVMLCHCAAERTSVMTLKPLTSIWMVPPDTKPKSSMPNTARLSVVMVKSWMRASAHAHTNSATATTQVAVRLILATPVVEQRKPATARAYDACFPQDTSLAAIYNPQPTQTSRVRMLCKHEVRVFEMQIFDD